MTRVSRAGAEVKCLSLRRRSRWQSRNRWNEDSPGEEIMDLECLNSAYVYCIISERINCIVCKSVDGTDVHDSQQKGRILFDTSY